MFPHPDSVIALGIIMHHELQAETIQMRRAMNAVTSRPAQPGLVRRTRAWMGSVFVRIGISLQAEPEEPVTPHTAFHMGTS
jgi:hypothetical protein